MKTKIMILLLSFAFLGSCGLLDRKLAGYRGFAEICVDGVSYLQFTSGASVKYTKEGRIATCD